MADFELIIGPYNSSSQSLSAWLALHAAGLEFRTVRLETADRAVVAAMREWSPSGRLPVLRRDGIAIAWELWAILEFAAEQVPTLWPREPSERARARSIAAEAIGFGAFQTFLPMDFTGRFASPAALLRPVAREVERLRAIWAECRERVGDAGPFLFGEFGLVDAVMVPLAARFRTHGLPLGPLEQGYVEALLTLDAVLFWEEQAQVERAGLVPAQPLAEPASRTAHASRGADVAASQTAVVSAPSSSPSRPPSPTETAPAPVETTSVSVQVVPTSAAPDTPPAAEAEPVASVSVSGNDHPQPTVEPDAPKAEPAPRRPLFGQGGLFRRRTAAETKAGFGPLPLGPTPLPGTPRPETLRATASAAAVAGKDEPQAGPEKPAKRTPPIKPIGTGLHRRR
jgi:glutathione S-transferase